MGLARVGVIAALLGALLGVGEAQEPPRTRVENPRPLLFAAIDSPAGEAHGVLAGRFAEAVTKYVHAGSPIFVDVTTERRYKQAGCSRLRVVLSWQGSVVLPGKTAPEKHETQFGINYCRDGRPPQDLS